MHTTDTRHRFLELRAQGWSLARIATELHLSKTTLVDWNRTARQEIRELKEVEVEALQERVLVSYELELQRFTSQLNRIESLFVLAAMVRRAVAPSHLCALADDPRRRGVAGCHVHPGPDGGPAMNAPVFLVSSCLRGYSSGGNQNCTVSAPVPGGGSRALKCSNRLCWRAWNAVPGRGSQSGALPWRELRRFRTTLDLKSGAEIVRKWSGFRFFENQAMASWSAAVLCRFSQRLPKTPEDGRSPKPDRSWTLSEIRAVIPRIP